MLHHGTLKPKDSIAPSNFTMPRYSLDDVDDVPIRRTVFEAADWTGKVGWVNAYSDPTYHDLMKNTERDTSLNNADYCYPCLWAGGTWSNADNKNFCTFSNRVLSYLWKANPRQYAPRGTKVSLIVD